MNAGEWLVQWAIVLSVLGVVVAFDRYSKGQWPWK
jgi:hypothetical protein